MRKVSKSYKLKNNDYIDCSGVAYKGTKYRKNLKELLNNLFFSDGGYMATQNSYEYNLQAFGCYLLVAYSVNDSNISSVGVYVIVTPNNNNKTGKIINLNNNTSFNVSLVGLTLKINFNTQYNGLSLNKLNI